MIFPRALVLTLTLSVAAPFGLSAQALRPFTPEVALDVRTVRIADVTRRSVLPATTAPA